jgi:Spy/CpxP family protein refolding chaperone
MEVAMRFVLVLTVSLMAGGPARTPAAFQDPPKQPSKKAEPKGLPPNFGQLVAAAILDKLDLNVEQQEQVARLQREFRTKSTEIRDRTQSEVDKVREAGPVDKAGQRKLNGLFMEMVKGYQKLRTEYELRLRAVLDDEQKKKYLELLKEKAKADKEKEEKKEKK